MQRTGTFFVEAAEQLRNLVNLRREGLQLAELYSEDKPLCFSAASYQKTHPARRGHRDADATLQTPCVLGVADGVSQVDDFGIDAAQLPQELLSRCKALAEQQLRPDSPDGGYRGPIPLVRQAFQETAPTPGATTLLLAVLDNTTKMHGKLHPMLAAISIGDCELLLLRRVQGEGSRLTPVLRTEMQRIDGHVRTPLQLARVPARMDANFHDGVTVEVIEKGSAVHCVSAYEGDIVVMGSDGVFDNLFTSEIADIVNGVLSPGSSYPAEQSKISFIARQIVEASHLKTRPQHDGHMRDAPIGPGGKADDTACVVAEVVDLESSGDEHSPTSDQSPGPSVFVNPWGCSVPGTTADPPAGWQRLRRRPPPPQSDGSSSDDDDAGCCVA